jgi:hypothetical protein
VFVLVVMETVGFSVTFCRPVSVIIGLHLLYRLTFSLKDTEMVLDAHGYALDCWMLFVVRIACSTNMGLNLPTSWRIADIWIGIPVAEMLTGKVGSCGIAGL